jgi:hypothetical protein
MDDLDAFLACERPDDVALFIADSYVDDVEPLLSYGERVADGVVIVVDGERGRNAFQAATGNDAMAFAKRAMGEDGDIAPDLTGGRCPDRDTAPDPEPDLEDEEAPLWEDAADHQTKFTFAFAEEQNEEVDGLYAEGDVIHAYAQCSCGTAYSQKWLAGER